MEGGKVTKGEHEKTSWSRDYEVVTTRCLWCNEEITEYRPKNLLRLLPESRGKRIQCHECLARSFR